MIEEIEIKAAKARIAKMMQSKYVEATMHKHISAYLDANEMAPLDFLSAAIEDLEEECEEPNEPLILIYQAMLQAVSKILAQNTHDLVTLLNTRAAKK